MDNPVTANAEIIKTLDPQLTDGLSDDTINALISDAQLISISDGFPKFVTDIDGNELPVRDMATRYMTMHLVTTSGDGAKNLTSEKIDVIEEHYADTSKLDWLNRSPWGQAYMRLYNLYGNGGMTHYAVVQH